MNQFFYSYEGGTKEKPLTFTGSFNINKIVRVYSAQKENCLVVMLDDFHEEYLPMDVPKNAKKPEQGSRVEMRKTDVASHIELNEEDSQRFRKLTEIK